MKNIAIIFHNQMQLIMTSSRVLYKYNQKWNLKKYTAHSLHYIICKKRQNKHIVLNTEPDFLLIYRPY